MVFKETGIDEVKQFAKNFRKKYEERYNIIEHIYPDVSRGKYIDKNQFSRHKLIYK